MKESMIRGTTPTLEFIIPFNTDQLAICFITLSQKGLVVVEKTLSNCTRDGNKLSVRLSQEETLKLQHGCVTEIQIRAKTLEGEAIASQIIQVNTQRILRDGVI